MGATHKDHSGSAKLPPIPPLELVLYHWSPTTNRKSIEKKGLVPGKKSLQKGWRPPYVAFADDPNLAWSLSGRMWPEIPSWDLWLVYHEHQESYEHWEIITDTYVSSGRPFVKEYRIYTRIFKRDVLYVATRTQ